MIEVNIAKPTKRNIFVKKLKTISKASVFDPPRKENFTGIIKDRSNNRAYYVNGVIHKEDGPAIEHADGQYAWYYNGQWYGENNCFTVESWIEFVENKKRELELNIFK